MKIKFILYSFIAITTPPVVYDRVNKQQNNTSHDTKGELKEAIIQFNIHAFAYYAFYIRSGGSTDNY